MSLKVLGRWKAWGDSMHRCFGRIQEEVHAKHPVVEPQLPPSQVDGAKAVRSALHKYPTRKDAHDTPFDEEEDEAVEGSEMKPVGAYNEDERHLEIMRKVMRKWRRLAGLTGDPALCDEMGEAEFMVNWTKVS